MSGHCAYHPALFPRSPCPAVNTRNSHVKIEEPRKLIPCNMSRTYVRVICNKIIMAIIFLVIKKFLDQTYSLFTKLLFHKFTYRVYIYILTYIYIYIYMTCSNKMSRMSANLILRKHRKNINDDFQWLEMLISHLYYFVAFLQTLCNISRMNFFKPEPINCTCSSRILRGFPQRMADISGITGKPRAPSFGYL